MEGRFYVVCVGQFKRGKSTLLNALVGMPVLPTGIVPVTAVITIVRYGERLAARVRFASGESRECDPTMLATYVSEEQNPGNEKGVTAVEVFVCSPLLESGMCLVDTPGIGSVFTASTETTRAFVPHIDAALVIIGAEPPLSGDELVLLQEVTRQTGELIFVLNKADRLSMEEKQEASRFAERVLTNHLHRPIGPILEVSAVEHLAGSKTPRDWNALVAVLESLTRQSGASLLRAAEERGTTRLIQRLLYELDEQQGALLRPIEESQARIDSLRRAVAAAERSLADLGPLFSAEQERLARKFTEEGDRFFARALPDALQQLRDAICSEIVTGPKLRQRALDHAITIMKRVLHRWRQEKEPEAEALYRKASRRFVELANTIQDQLVTFPGWRSLPPLADGAGFRTKSRLYYTEMLATAPTSPGKWLVDVVGRRSRRARAVERDASNYLERLLCQQLAH